MSRIHDALRKAGGVATPEQRRPLGWTGGLSEELHAGAGKLPGALDENSYTSTALAADELDAEVLEGIIFNAPEQPFTPFAEALLVNPDFPQEAPAEEFRTLRTRLNHLQTQSPLHTLVVTSASPGEGKSFTALNLAITQAQLANRRVLLADFDLRRPTVDTCLQIHCAPGISDYLQKRAQFSDILRRIGPNLYVLTAGQPVPNPLELLNLLECKALIDALRNHFDWIILDSPPLLFAADGNLLATMCDATILVVRIGETTHDSVTRAMQSLCENNVIGVVVNGARSGELYSSYNYYGNSKRQREESRVSEDQPESPVPETPAAPEAQ
jgi:protein-tyrosine kinase